MDKRESFAEDGKLDFLSEILVDGQELEINFSSFERTNFKITGTLKIEEQSLLVKPRIGVINSPKAEAWMCTHPKYWKILCGLEPADLKTNVHISGMLIRAGLYELSQMMSRRINVMQSYYSMNDGDILMPNVPEIDK